MDCILSSTIFLAETDFNSCKSSSTCPCHLINHTRKSKMLQTKMLQHNPIWVSNKDEFTSPSPFLISCITSKMSCLLVAYSPMIHKAWRWILQESKFKFHIVNELGNNNNNILTYCNNEVATSQYAPYIDIQYVTLE